MSYQALVGGGLALAILVSFSSVQAQEQILPDWIKDVAGFWSNGQISDADFFGVIQYLIDNNLITTSDDALYEPEDIRSEYRIGDTIVYSGASNEKYVSVKLIYDKEIVSEKLIITKDGRYLAAFKITGDYNTDSQWLVQADGLVYDDNLGKDWFDVVDPNSPSSKIDISDPDIVPKDTEIKTPSFTQIGFRDAPIKLPYKLDKKYMITGTGYGSCEMTINGFKKKSLGSTYELTPDITITSTELDDTCTVNLFDQKISNFELQVQTPTDMDSLLRQSGVDALTFIHVSFTDDQYDTKLYSARLAPEDALWRFDTRPNLIKQFDPYLSIRVPNDVEMEEFTLYMTDYKKFRESGADIARDSIYDFEQIVFLEPKILN